MFKFVTAAATILFALSAGAAQPLPTAKTGTPKAGHIVSAYEMSRQQALKEAKDEVQLLDRATPEEIEQLFGIVPDADEMQPADPLRTEGATVDINVSIASQSLTMTSPEGSFSTAISSARPGYHTKTGCFWHPHLELMHYSSRYDNSPMPHSMFYYGGYAVHGTYEEAELGHPASHGCVRVSLDAATYLYGIVQQYGAGNTRICVH